MEKHCTNKHTLIIKFILFLFLIFGFQGNAQGNKNESVYIFFNKYSDSHYNEKGKINYFDICIDNKLVSFVYGTGKKVEKIKELKYPITSRKKLATIIANDSFEKKPKFYIIEKVGDEYLIRSADYRFRLEEHDESFWNK